MFRVEHWWGLRSVRSVCSLPPHSALLCLPNGMCPTRLKTRGLSPPFPRIKAPSSGGMETGQHLTDGSE